MFMRLPLDYPRINQFPEWFAADPTGRYRVNWGPKRVLTRTGDELTEGLAVTIAAGTILWIEVEKQ
jgi:hypothetical protein